MEQVLTLGSIVSLVFGLSAFLGVLWTWWRNARLVKKEISDEAVDKTSKEQQMQRYFEKIDAQSKLLGEMAESIKKLAADLVNNQNSISELHRLRSQQADEIEDLQKGINTQYKIIQELNVSIAKLTQSTENLVLSVNGLNDRQMSHTSQIAKLEGKLESLK